ncbi:GNAT family N-acetyltransferase [Streptococcus anginosus]|uniref:GNAT family N-acetyltransferase n=1 Tax=Streptococcus anginosus TaxID=1328 RepID=UPI001CD2F73D|nr:GNAT family N-acetyltransferase [Streptococcus anginosus]MCW1032565.1 GNAT family N-acetyltransferase [Streptococcus anginosus]MCW1068670.1 GNAT family N-acetyltransferase [Streptococcus anginosus]MED5788940.1 GNAT family N-acetyltransferase [Streptococcus anginosus]MED5837616.1 GNAT family N-acetyltransferase [Streptococcus anginosus]MED5849121.1 GNAT family N-acetyltransferase [Streptococcus anginosus]
MSLDDLLSALKTEEIKSIFNDFISINQDDSPHDVELFLKTKAIDFERTAIATTYLVFDEGTNILLGFFSLANKPLTMSKKNFEGLSKKQQKSLRHSGRQIGNKFQVNSYLIGQLGKNYSESVQNAEYKLNGKELLDLAYGKVLEASKIIKAKYVWIECEDIQYLKTFYSDFGFAMIPDYFSSNNLRVMMMRI